MIHDVVLTANDERYAPPPQPVLRIMQAGPVVVLEIASVDETRDETTYAPLATLSVKGTELRAALQMLDAENGAQE